MQISLIFSLAEKPSQLLQQYCVGFLQVTEKLNHNAQLECQLNPFLFTYLVPYLSGIMVR